MYNVWDTCTVIGQNDFDKSWPAPHRDDFLFAAKDVPPKANNLPPEKW